MKWCNKQIIVSFWRLQLIFWIITKSSNLVLFTKPLDFLGAVCFLICAAKIWEMFLKWKMKVGSGAINKLTQTIIDQDIM